MIDVIGIDPSLRATGFCAPNGTTYTIKTGEAIRGDNRLHDLRRALVYYLRKWVPRLAVIEVPTRFQTADAAIAAGMAQGVIRETLAEYRIPVGRMNPTTVKMFATGKGNADKVEMVTAANRHRFDLHTRGKARVDVEGAGDGIYDDLVDDNQADAWWLWQMGRWHLGARDLNPSLDEFLHSASFRDAKVKPSKGVKWPG